MLDLRLEKPEAVARLRELDAEQKRLRKARFKGASAALADAAFFDLTLSLTHMDAAEAAEVLAAAAAKRLDQQGLLSPNAADEIEFEDAPGVGQARHCSGTVPRAVTRASFGHPSEEIASQQPAGFFTAFSGNTSRADFPTAAMGQRMAASRKRFTPDFYLPELDCSMWRSPPAEAVSLVTQEKSQGQDAAAAIYPHYQHIKCSTRKIFQDLVFKYGLKMVHSCTAAPPDNVERILFTEEQVSGAHR